MPRNVRNFWLDGRIDGRSSRLEGGPQSKDGGFSLTIKQREDDGIIIAARIWGTADDDSRLRLHVEVADADELLTVETSR